MDEISVRTFNCVVETLNLTQAAELMGLSKGTLSRKVQALEQEIGYQLFRRHPRGITLTAAGKAFYKKSKQLQDLFWELKNDLYETHTVGDRSIALIAVASSFVKSFILPLLQDLLKEVPDTTVKVMFDNKRFRDFKQFENGLCIGFVSSVPKNETEYIAKELCAYKIYPFGSKQYFAIHGYPQHLSDLKDHTFIGYELSSTFELAEHNEATAYLSHLFETPKKAVHLWTDDLLTCKTLITSHYGIGLLPKFLADTQTMEMLPFELTPFRKKNFHLYACYPLAFKGNKLIQTVLNFIAKKISEQKDAWEE